MALFVRVWIFLLVLTAIEVFLAYVRAPLGVMLAALLGLSLAKAAYIIAYFMHMKYERRVLRWSLFPVLVLLILALLGLLPDAARAQCVQCKRTAEARNAGETRALNRAIVVLITPAMVAMVVLLRRAARR